MGMDLRGAGGVARYARTTWSDLLRLAYRYGWRPAGTEAPEWRDADGNPTEPRYRDWDGSNYFSNRPYSR